MFKFLRRLFFIVITAGVILTGSIIYMNFCNQEKILKDLTTVSNTENTNDTRNNTNKSTTNSNSNDSDSSISVDSLKEIAKDYIIETDSSNISQVISDIVSNEDNYNILVKYNNAGAILSLDTVSRKFSVVNLDTLDDFKNLSSQTDKYIDFDNSEYSIEDFASLKDNFMSSGVIEKYEIVKSVLKNSDTNIKESDLISMYFNYMASK